MHHYLHLARGTRDRYLADRREPILKKYIALAHLKSTHAKRGTRVEMEVTAEHQRKRAAARVVDTPFFNPERKRAWG